MKINPEMIFIYGIFNECGSCVYVGRSCSPMKRFNLHQCVNGKFHGRKVTMKVFRATLPQHANRIENQIGVAYRKRGQAIYSKTWTNSPKIPKHIGGTHVYVEGIEKPFPSINAAGRALGVSNTTVSEYLRVGFFFSEEYERDFRIATSPMPLVIDFQI
jgi:hypothetical protein